MKVTLLTHTPDPDKIVAIAARQCYSANDAFGIAEKLSSEDIGKFIQKLLVWDIIVLLSMYPLHLLLTEYLGRLVIS